MKTEWDFRKAVTNARKHGVYFADAAIALEDPMLVTVADPDSCDEERYVSVGKDPHGRVLVTVFTLRADIVRIISSRKASVRERRRYEEAQ